MSMIKDLEETRAALATLTAEHAALVASSLAGIEKLTADHKTALDAMGAKVAELTQANATHLETIRIAGEKALEAVAALAAKDATITDLAGKLQKAEHALENPAFADASKAGRATPIADAGGDVEASSAATPTWDEFNKITDETKRTAFWNANETKLRAEMASASAKRL